VEFDAAAVEKRAVVVLAGIMWPDDMIVPQRSNGLDFALKASEHNGSDRIFAGLGPLDCPQLA
jgi:hypothetical protein